MSPLLVLMSSNVVLFRILVNDIRIRYDDKNHRRCARDEERWIDAAKGIIKAELKRRNLKYRDLAERLSSAGQASEMDERNLRNKIARGTFTAAFMLECLAAIGVQNLRLEDLPKAVESV